MKSFAVIAAVAGVATAQSLSSCAQMCANNMATIAQTQYQCASGDVGCFCSKSNWAYGLRDCSAQACGATDSAAAVAWAAAQCNGAVASAPAASAALSIVGGSAAASATAVLASASGAVASAVASGAQSIPVTTVPLLATITNSAGSVITQTTGFSTVYSSLTGAAASAASSLASNQASLASSASGAVASALSSASAALSSGASAARSAASSAASAAASGASGAPSSGAAVPMKTAMPIAAAAGAAAMFFL